jgi:flagellar hook protein FlgE
MSAFGAAISGLQSSEQWLSVISNNVANSETVGYKSSQLNFADLISQTLSSPSGDNSANNLGGIDATQVGLGVTVGSIATDISQGAIETTGNVTDIAIQGQGYLTVKSGDQSLYTRAGNLTFDSNGDLVTAEGGLVQGWSITTNLQPTAPPAAGGPPPPMTLISQALNTTNTADIGDIVIPNNLQIAPMATSDNTNTANQALGVSLAGNLDSSTPNTGWATLTTTTPTYVGYAGGAPTAQQALAIAQNADATSNFTVYDSLGNPTNITMYWFQTANVPAAPASWSYIAVDTTGGAVPTAGVAYPTPGAYLFNGGLDAANAAGIATTLQDAVTFNNNGSLATNGTGSTLNGTVSLPTVDGSLTPFIFSVNTGTPNNPGAVGPPAIAATWGDSNGLTGDYGGGTTNPTTGVYTPVQSIYTKSVDGYEEGTLTGLSFNDTGGIAATFSNGQTIVVAQLALTNFTNPGGLANDGGNYFTQTDNSGSAQVGTAGSIGLGTIQGGALEESNVSLSTELTNMILAQNMYQANAKVITTQGNLFTDLFDAIPQQ